MQSDGFNSALSPVVYGDIALSINTQYNTTLSRQGLLIHVKLHLYIHMRIIYSLITCDLLENKP